MNEPQTPAKGPEIVSLTAETLGRDILAALLDEVKQHVSWGSLNFSQQDLVIDRLNKRTRALIIESLNILFKGSYPAIPAELDSVTIRNGITAKVTIPKTSKDWHELADAQGSTILIVVADPEQYAARMDEIKAAANQKDLFEQPEVGPYRRDQLAPSVHKSWQDLMDHLNGSEEGPAKAGEMAFGTAAEGERKPDKSMAEHVVEQLAKVFVVVQLETAKAFTEQECLIAHAWATAYLANRDTAPARPHWLPLPDPPPEIESPPPAAAASDAALPSPDEDDDNEDDDDDEDRT